MVEHDKKNCPRCTPYETDREFGILVVSPMLFQAKLLAQRGELISVCEVLERLEERLTERIEETARLERMEEQRRMESHED